MTDVAVQIVFAAEARDLATLATRSAEIWAGLALDQVALSALRRDGLDPAAFRLSRPHPFAFACVDTDKIGVTAHAPDREAAEALLDLFRVAFLRRLLA